MISESEQRDSKGNLLNLITTCILQNGLYETYSILDISNEAYRGQITANDHKGFKTTMMGRLIDAHYNLRLFVIRGLKENEWDFDKYPNPEIMLTEVLLKEETPEARDRLQIEKWANGSSVHNGPDNKCTPDFSCCHKGIDTPIQKRQEFQRLFKSGGATACEKLLTEFLKAALEITSDNKVKVIPIFPPPPSLN